MGTIDLTELLSVMRKLKPYVRSRYKAKEIGIFGSVARGDAGSDSDIDFLVEFDEGADVFDLVGLADYLEENFGLRVDVVSKNALKAECRETILQQLILI